MPIDITFHAAMSVLAELAGPEHPPHVRVRAASKIASELSPLNNRHAEVVHAVNGESPEPATQPAAALPPPSGEHFYACYDPQNNPENNTEHNPEESDESDDSDQEDDESEGANPDDDPL